MKLKRVDSCVASFFNSILWVSTRKYSVYRVAIIPLSAIAFLIWFACTVAILLINFFLEFKNEVLYMRGRLRNPFTRDAFERNRKNADKLN